MWCVSHEACWTPALEKRARREAHPPIGVARGAYVERLRRHGHDRSLFTMQWEAIARRFTHAVQYGHPRLVVDPEEIDVLVIELQSLARFAHGPAFEQFTRARETIERLAATTRHQRQIAAIAHDLTALHGAHAAQA